MVEICKIRFTRYITAISWIGKVNSQREGGKEMKKISGPTLLFAPLPGSKFVLPLDEKPDPD